MRILVDCRRALRARTGVGDYIRPARQACAGLARETLTWEGTAARLAPAYRDARARRGAR